MTCELWITFLRISDIVRKLFHQRLYAVKTLSDYLHFGQLCCIVQRTF